MNNKKYIAIGGVILIVIIAVVIFFVRDKDKKAIETINDLEQINDNTEFVEESEYFEFDETTGTITGYNDNAPKEVVIPNEIDGVEVIAIGDNAFNNKEIVTLEIPSSVTKIGESAFSNNEIGYVKIQRELIEIGEQAFFNNNIEKVIVPITLKVDGLEATAENLIKYKVFDQSVKILVETDIAYFDFDKANGVITGYKMIGGIDVVIPSEIDGVEVVKIGELAFYSKGIESVELPETIIEIDDMAFANNKLSYVDFPENLRFIGKNAFSENILTSVDFKDNIEEIFSHAFSYNNLETLELPSSLRIIHQFSFYENDFDSVIIPSGLTNISVEVMYQQFELYPLTLDSLIENMVFDTDVEIIFEGKELTEETDVSFFTFDKESGTITGYSYNGPNDVVIPSEIDGVPVTTIGESAFYMAWLRSVVIPDTVTEIKAYAFCENDIKNLKLPKDLKIIEERAFASALDKNYLIDLELPNGIKKIGDYAFSYNDSIANVTLPNSITYIGEYAFFRNALTSLKIPNNKELTEIKERAFAENNLIEVIIPSNIKSVESHAFFKNNIESLTIKNGVEIISYSAFENNNISSLILPNSVVDVGLYAFKDNLIENLKLSENMYSIGIGAFSNNIITSVEIPEKLDNGLITSETWEVMATSENLYNYEVFDRYTTLEMEEQVGDAIVPKSYNHYTDEKYFTFDKTYGMIEGYSADGPKIVDIPPTIDGVEVKYIKSRAFFEMGITSVSIPSSVKHIYDNAFYGNDITYVKLNEGLEKIFYSAFRENDLSEINIPSTVIHIGRSAFSNNNLEYIEIPDELQEIGEYAFYNNNIREVDIPYTVERIDIHPLESNGFITGSYVDAKNLKKYMVFDDYVDIYVENQKITKESFFQFDKETKTITGYRNDGPKDVVIPRKIDGIAVMHIGNNTFSDKGINSVTLPENLKTIGTEAFANNNLTELNIPSSVVKIGEYAFKGNNLTIVYLQDTISIIDTGAFMNNKLERVIVEGNGIIGADAFRNNSIVNLDLKKFNGTIGSYAFASNNISQLTYMSIESIAEGAFGFNNISEVNIGSYSNGSIADINLVVQRIAQFDKEWFYIDVDEESIKANKIFDEDVIIKYYDDYAKG